MYPRLFLLFSFLNFLSVGSIAQTYFWEIQASEVLVVKEAQYYESMMLGETQASETLEKNKLSAQILLNITRMDPFIDQDTYGTETKRLKDLVENFVIQACHYNVPEAEECKDLEIKEINPIGTSSDLGFGSRKTYRASVNGVWNKPMHKLVSTSVHQYSYGSNPQMRCEEIEEHVIDNLKACESRCKKTCTKVYSKSLDLGELISYESESSSFLWFDTKKVEASMKDRELCVSLVKHQCVL